MKREALISKDGRYRYWLTRSWGQGDRLCFVMLNPSTADADYDDPTIRRCIGFAKREDYDGINVVNLFAFRATDPGDLRRASRFGMDITGPENDKWINEAFPFGHVVFGWGSNARHWPLRTEAVAGMVEGPMCLGVTKDGHPRHPLMVRADEPFVNWTPS